MLRVGRVAKSLPPEPGGQEIHVAELTRALTDRGVAQHTYCHCGGPLDRGGDVTRTRWGPRSGRLGLLSYGLQVAVLLTRAHQQQRFDVLHVHGDFPEALAAAAAARRCDVPAILTVHSGLVRRTRHDLLRYRAFSAMDRIIAISDYVAANIEELGTDTAITVRPDGVRAPFLSAGWKQQRTPLIMFSGRLAPVKAPDVLIGARDILSEEAVELDWLLAAPKPQDPYGRRIARMVGSRPNMKLLLDRTPTQLASLLERASVFVMPSLPEPSQVEGLSTATLEAMAVGVPVVASATGGLTGLLEHGRAGDLVRPGDPQRLADGIMRTLHNPADARERAHRARSSGVVQSWPDIARATIDDYRAVMSGRRARPNSEGDPVEPSKAV